MTCHYAIASTSKGVISKIQVPTRASLGYEDVLLKVEYASLAPFDTYVTDEVGFAPPKPAILGMNAAGIVTEVGEGVKGLNIGDRVVAYTIGPPEVRAFQQYGAFPMNLCCKVPDSMALEAAATIPDNFITAYYTLFDQLALAIPVKFPTNNVPAQANLPILIYGCGTTAGIYTVQLLRLSGYTNILSTASPHHEDYLKGLGVKKNFDYASNTLVEDILVFVDGKIPIAIDCVSTTSSMKNISKVVGLGGTVAVLLPIKTGENLVEGEVLMDFPDTRLPFSADVKVKQVRTFRFQDNEYLKTHLMRTILTEALASGVVEPNNLIVLDEKYGDDLQRTEFGLHKLRRNEVKGEKLVVKISH